MERLTVQKSEHFVVFVFLHSLMFLFVVVFSHAIHHNVTVVGKANVE